MTNGSDEILKLSCVEQNDRIHSIFPSVVSVFYDIGIDPKNARLANKHQYGKSPDPSTVEAKVDTQKIFPRVNQFMNYCTERYCAIHGYDLSSIRTLGERLLRQSPGTTQISHFYSSFLTGIYFLNTLQGSLYFRRPETSRFFYPSNRMVNSYNSHALSLGPILGGTFLIFPSLVAHEITLGSSNPNLITLIRTIGLA